MKKYSPVFWLMWLLPGAAVLASFATLAIAMQSADRALPDIYHWEGTRLDADFERARNAARHGLSALIEISHGACTVTLVRAPADADALELRLTNGSHAGDDRVHELRRVRPGFYGAACQPLPPGRWRIALQDAGHTWSMRGQSAAFARLELRARHPEGRAP